MGFFSDLWEGRNMNGPEDFYYNRPGESGTLRLRINWKDGLKNGPEERYYENGQLQEKTTYKDNVKHGPYEAYTENGRLRYKGTYEDGKNTHTF